MTTLHGGKYQKLISLIVLLIFWQASAIALDLELFPTPVMVFESMIYHAFEDELFYHLGMTLFRVFIAFVIAMLIGLFFGIAMGHYSKLNNQLDALLILGLNLPALVTIMLCYIWFGLTDTAALLAVIINKVPTVIVTVREGARAINHDFMEIGQVYKLPKLTIFRKIYLPQLYPYIMSSARNGLALIWKIVLVVELLGRSNGVGFQLSMFFQFFDITSILAYSGAFIIVILLIESLIIQPLDKKVTQWR